MKRRVRIYFHRSKESNFDLANELGIPEESKAIEHLKYLGTEIETYFEIDTKTGEGKLIGAEGFFLGDETYEHEKEDPTPAGGSVKDLVNHPSHYNSGKIEVIEALEDWGLNFHRANAVKYVARAGKKDPSKEVEDLKKAMWYLNREIYRLECIQNGLSSQKPDDTPILTAQFNGS